MRRLTIYVILGFGVALLSALLFIIKYEVSMFIISDNVSVLTQTESIEQICSKNYKTFPGRCFKKNPLESYDGIPCIYNGVLDDYCYRATP